MAQDNSPEPNKARIPASDGEYPPYEMTFDGDLVVVPGSHIQRPIEVRGSHSFNLPPVAPDVNIRVVLTNEDHDPGVPNLKIVLRRKGPNDPE